MRTLILRYPLIIEQSRDQVIEYFEFMDSIGIEENEAMFCLLEAPKIITRDLPE